MANQDPEDTLRTPESEEGTKAEGEEEEMKVDGEEEEEKAAAEEEEEEEGTPVGKKGTKKKVAAPEGVEVTPVAKKERRKKEAAATPAGRPSRERKTVERFSALTPPRSSGSKTLSIQQGPGTKLKDIPNVLFKLNKRKVDDNLQHLHSILFSKRIKAFYVKRNILQFSGFVWTENKEKQREKVKERLEKCVKDKLLDFCEILDIPVNRASTKKEDVSTKVLEFLESPRVTRDVLLAEKEQSSKKRKRQKNARERRSGEKAKRGRKNSTKVDNEQNEMEMEGDSADEEDKEDATQEDDVEGRELEEKTEPEENSEEGEDEGEIHVEKKTHVSKKASPSKNKVRGTPKKGSDSKNVEKSPSKEDSEGKKKAKRGKQQQPGKVSVEEKLDSKVSSEDTSKDAKRLKRAKESPSKKKLGGEHGLQSTENSNKGKGKTKSKKTAVQPSREEMHSVVSEILKEVDFNTATLADILRKLGAHFKMDLTDRKAEVKSIIEDVINSMTDDEGEGDEGDGEKETPHGSSEDGDA